MTDEELEKRAERYARNSLSTLADTVIQDNVKLAYIKGAKEGNQLKERLDLNEKVRILGCALLSYLENKDLSSERELRHQVNVLSQKVSDFMTGGE